MTRRTFLTLTACGLVMPRLALALPGGVHPAVHPLNHPTRCAGWWLVTPHTGNAYWGDVLRRRVGVTTGASAGSGVQRGTTRPGGLGEMVYDGVGVSTTLPDLLDNAPTLSLSCWVRAPLTNTRQALITKSTDYSSSAPGWYLVIHSSNLVGLWVVQDASNYFGVNGLTSVTDGAWHHVVGVVSDWGTLALWLDGVPETTEPSSVGTVSTISTSEPVRLGTFGNGTDPFQGGMDDVHLYNTVLTPAEIQTLRHDPRQGYRALLAEEGLVVRAPVADTRTRGPGLLFQ
jgi:hypothetical protein